MYTSIYNLSNLHSKRNFIGAVKVLANDCDCFYPLQHLNINSSNISTISLIISFNHLVLCSFKYTE